MPTAPPPERDHRATLAANVRRLRESRGQSLQQLADRCGIAKTTLFKIERGRSNPTLETLLAIGDFFSVSLLDLIGDGEDAPIDVVRAGGGVDISDSVAGGALLKSMLIGPTLVEVLDLSIHAGQSEVSMSHGPGAREHVLVREGRVVVGPDRHQVELGPGDYATYASDRPHRWENRGRSDARVWVVHTFPRAASAVERET